MYTKTVPKLFDVVLLSWNPDVALQTQHFDHNIARRQTKVKCLSFNGCFL